MLRAPRPRRSSARSIRTSPDLNQHAGTTTLECWSLACCRVIGREPTFELLLARPAGRHRAGVRHYPADNAGRRRRRVQPPAGSTLPLPIMHTTTRARVVRGHEHRLLQEATVAGSNPASGMNQPTGTYE